MSDWGCLLACSLLRKSSNGSRALCGLPADCWLAVCCRLVLHSWSRLLQCLILLQICASAVALSASCDSF